MTDDLIEGVATRVSGEAAEDYVGLWTLVRDLRRRMPQADDSALLMALEQVVRRVLSSHCVFGQFVSDRRFVVWPADGIVERIRDELASLGRDPDIGEVGWFVAAAEMQG